MKSNVINFYINRQTITTDISQVELVENSVGYLRARLHFSADWDKTFKVLVYENKGSVIAVHADEQDSDNGEFEIPYEVIKAPGFKVSCFGSETRVNLDQNGLLNVPYSLKRITTEPVYISLKVSGPLAANTATQTAKELNIYEISLQALDISKQAYSLFWGMQFSLQEINDMLGGNIALTSNAEILSPEVYNRIANTRLQYSENGLPIQDENGNYIFEEVDNE